jgi:hypothetical protein
VKKKKCHQHSEMSICVETWKSGIFALQNLVCADYEKMMNVE